MSYTAPQFPSTVPYSYGPGITQPPPAQPPSSELDFAMFDTTKPTSPLDPANASSVGARLLPPSSAVQDFSHYSIQPPHQQQQPQFSMSYAPPLPQQQQPSPQQYVHAPPSMPWTQQFSPGWNSPAAQMGYTPMPPQAYYAPNHMQPPVAYPMQSFSHPPYFQHPMYTLPLAPIHTATALPSSIAPAPEMPLAHNNVYSDNTPTLIKKESNSPNLSSQNDRLHQTSRTTRHDDQRRQTRDNDSDDERHHQRARRPQRRSASPPRRHYRDRSRSRSYSPPRYISSPFAPRTIAPHHREPRIPDSELRDAYPTRVNTVHDAQSLFADAQIEGNFHKLFMLRAYHELLYDMREVFTTQKYRWAFPAHRQPNFHAGFRELARLFRESSFPPKWAEHAVLARHSTDGPGGANLPRLPDPPIPVPPPVTGSGANINFFGYAMYSILHSRPWNIVGALVTTHLACPSTIFGLQMQQMVVPPFGDYADKLRSVLWHWKITAAYFSANPPAYGKEIARLNLAIHPSLNLTRVTSDFIHNGTRDDFVAHYASCGATETTWHATAGFGLIYLAWAADPRNIRKNPRLNDFARDLLFRALASKVAHGFPPPWTTVRDSNPTSFSSIPLDLTDEPLDIPGNHDEVLDRRRRLACMYPLQYIEDRHRPSTRKSKSGSSRSKRSTGSIPQSEDVVMNPIPQNAIAGPSSLPATTKNPEVPPSTLDAMAPEFTLAIHDLLDDMDVNQPGDDGVSTPSPRTDASSESEDD